MRLRPILVSACVLASFASTAAFADDTGHSPLIETGVESGLQLAGERALFWGLPDRFASDAAYDTSRTWWELYVKPSVRARQQIQRGVEVYGELSAVGSATIDRDPFEEGDTGRLTLESAHVGVRVPDMVAGWALDLSVGAQPYSIASGMLISNGASNGFSRGALKLGPRKAFENTALMRLSQGHHTAELFYLDPNENPDSDSGTRLIGGAWSLRPDELRSLVLTVGRVIDSTAPYPQADPDGGAPQIIPGGRDGLSVLHAHLQWPLWMRDQTQVHGQMDYAVQGHQSLSLRAQAWRLQLNMARTDMPWRPRMVLGIQSFSGDDPSTARLERFDPLFYEGSPGAWASGSKASMVFINTNVRALQASLELRPSERDVVTLYVAHLRAHTLRSPLQFGQATRVEISDGVSAIVTGVTHPHLSDDVFIKYTRVVDRHTYVTLGYSASFPGKGVRRLTDGRTPVWQGWLANVVLAY